MPISRDEEEQLLAGRTQNREEEEKFMIMSRSVAVSQKIFRVLECTETSSHQNSSRQKRLEEQLIEIEMEMQRRGKPATKWWEKEKENFKKIKDKRQCVDLVIKQHDEINESVAESGIWEDWVICRAMQLMNDETRLSALLNSVTFEVQDEDWLQERKFQGIHMMTKMPRRAGWIARLANWVFGHQFHVILDDVAFTEGKYDERHDEILPEHPIVQLGFCTKSEMKNHKQLRVHSCLTKSMLPEQEYRVFFTKVQGLLYDVYDYNDNKIKLQWDRLALQLLCKLDQLPHAVFSTPLVQASVEYHWRYMMGQFWVDRVIDVILLSLYMILAYALHFQLVPRGWFLMILLALNMHSLLKAIAAMLAALRIRGCATSLVSFYNVLFFLLDVFVVSQLVLQVYLDRGLVLEIDEDSHSEGHGLLWFNVSTHENFHNSFQFRHPVSFFYAVGARWVSFLLTLFNVSAIGTAILPVFLAMKDPATIRFLLFLTAVVAGLTHAYFTFPTRHPDEDKIDSFWRVFRVFVVSEFDLFELEGTESHHRERLDGGMRAFVMFTIFIGPLLLLNVFIGVLSSAYDDAKAQINDILARFRLSALKLLLFRNYFWTCQCCFFGCSKTDPGPNEWKGMWIKLPSRCLVQSIDKEFGGLSTYKQVCDLQAAVEEITMTLRDIKQKVK